MSVDFNAIRAAHPLAEFCESLGIVLRRNGTAGHLAALCPLHKETTPSFTVYPDGYFYCYGCGAHGDVVDLCAAIDGVPIGEAARKLGGAPWVTSPSSLPAERPKPEPYRLNDAEITRMAEAAHRLAADNEKISRLCKVRPEWTYEAIWHTAFEGDLGIEASRILFGYSHGIKARWKDQRGERVIRWLCGGSGGQCWRQSSLRTEHQRVFITEGETDALTGISLGLEKDGRSLVVGLAGASVLPRPEPFKGREIVIIPDPDEAGLESARKLRLLLEPVARRLVVINLEELFNGQ
jgi:DNA primase